MIISFYIISLTLYLLLTIISIDFLNVIFNEERSKINERTKADNDADNILYYTKLENNYNKWSLLVCQRFLNDFYESKYLIYDVIITYICFYNS